jgi:hypothetical protein
MSGRQGAPAGVGPGAEFGALLRQLRIDVDSLQAGARGPARGWDWSRAADGTPAVVHLDSGQTTAIIAPGQDVSSLVERIEALEARATLPEGWEWLAPAGPTIPTLLLRLPDGSTYRMVESVGSAIAPLYFYGDSNTTDQGTVWGGDSWAERVAGESAVNLAINGRGWVFAVPGLPTILQDVTGTPNPVGTAVVNGGINDIANGVTSAAIQGAIAAAVANLLDRSVRVYVATILPTLGAYAGLNTQRVVMNNWLRAAWPAGGGVRVTVLDIASVVESGGLNGPLDPAYSYDGLHLNNAGHTAVAAYVRSVAGIGT